MKIVYSPKYEVDIGLHVFPTEKFRLIHDQLLKEGILKEGDFVEPESASEEDVLLVHTKEYVKKLKEGTLSALEIFTLELPYSKELVESSWLSAGGTSLACKNALKDGIGFHLGGGFHHAFPDHGEGFCVLNDIAIGIKKLLKDKDIKRAAVIDCDLHQGNGTAVIFQKDKNVFTFSIHQEHNYPPKEKSSLDIGLEDGADDEEYLAHLREHVPRIIKDFKPDFILYDAGADPYEGDQLGGLALTLEGLKKRDELVISEALKAKIPVAVVLGGGYAMDVNDTVKIHAQTAKVCYNFLKSR